MMHFGDIIGQQAAIRSLKRAIETGKISHAYLFSGPEGVGKMTAAAIFAAALNCEGENREDSEPCGKCRSCRLIDAGTHPDFQIISPEGAYTKIESMREMRRTAQFAPLRGRWKVNIIERAESLREEAASAILKTLEDAPSYLITILLTRNPAFILPTIRSRCQLVRFFPAPLDELTAALAQRAGVGEEEAAIAAAHAEGRPGRAISLLADESFKSEREEIVEIAERLSFGENAAFLRLSERFRSAAAAEGGDALEDEASEEPARKMPVGAGRAAVGCLIDTAILWYRDLLSVKLRGEEAPVINADRRSRLTAQAARYHGPEALIRALKTLAWARRAIDGNANIQLITDVMMLHLAACDLRPLSSAISHG